MHYVLRNLGIMKNSVKDSIHVSFQNKMIHFLQKNDVFILWIEIEDPVGRA